MFRRSTSTASTLAPTRARGDARRDPADELADERRRTRHTRRVRQRKAVDEAALQARLDRVHRRLAEVGSVQLTGRAHAIDNDTARRDPLTRPFSAPVDGPVPGRRTDTAAMSRPA
jgi:hypothetical protein